MKRFLVPIRVTVGGIFVAFGLNSFLGFAPMPQLPGDAGTLLALISESGVLGILRVVQVVAGLLLLADRFVPLALLVLTFVQINVLLFHLFFEPVMFPVAFLVLAMLGFLFWFYRFSFLDVLASRAEPAD